ncbi:hypothetical protein D6D28_05885 [Aureobasidium pullulans]|uniref:Uncharacterized protein n=1 Tax=Aureobasidium pullulans TaxID=5580 RepID=A0A4S8SFV3_AURPU|nr:hypothetical protein D6D28_05885 [Aureobasidium pullulans]
MAYVNNHETSIHENSEKVMAAFHDKMMALAEENTAQSATEAHEIAHLLLEHAELPLAIRARAHIVLSSGKTNYLHHAQEAVRIAQKGRDIFGPGSTPEAKAAAEGMLRRAERDMEELEDLKARKKAGTLKLKKDEKLLYGNINGELNPPPHVLKFVTVTAVEVYDGFCEWSHVQREDLQVSLSVDDVHLLNIIVRSDALNNAHWCGLKVDMTSLSTQGGSERNDETDRIADMPTVATSGTQDHVSSDGETDEEDAANKGTGLDAKEDNANKSKKEATPEDEVNEEEVSTEEEVNEDEVFTEEEPHIDRKYFKGISGPTSPIVTPRP